VFPDLPQAAEDNIAAISTPPGIGAIAVVRLSGPDALTVADRVFRGRVKLSEASPRTAHIGHVVSSSGEKLDEVVATVYSAPKSYTGENMVEVSCHGGPLPASLVFEALLWAGARAAGPGEFTKRAFLSGRIDLSQAEAVAQVIYAKSRAGLKAALAQVDGALSKKVAALRERLVSVLADLEARLDFAEDVEEPVDLPGVARAIEKAMGDIERVIAAGELGRLAWEGARVVIAGRPNVGKSSLLNSILGKDRAIVTPVPGTTRDTVEEWVELDGLLLTLADTAGLRPTTDFVEAEGVRRTRALLREGQLVLAVLELPSSPGSDDREMIIELARQAPVIPVLNKCDLGGDRAAWERALVDLAGSRSRVLPAVITSALTGEGVRELKERVVGALLGHGPYTELDASEVLLTNARHVAALRRTSEALGRASEGIESGLSEELLAFEVGQALQALGEVTGETVTEEVLDAVFCRFCIGK
jgi:tRNA modification GTPase